MRNLKSRPVFHCVPLRPLREARISARGSVRADHQR
jgi:hypothetical protein